MFISITIFLAKYFLFMFLWFFVVLSKGEWCRHHIPEGKRGLDIPSGQRKRIMTQGSKICTPGELNKRMVQASRIWPSGKLNRRMIQASRIWPLGQQNRKMTKGLRKIAILPDGFCSTVSLNFSYILCLLRWLKLSEGTTNFHNKNKVNNSRVYSKNEIFTT